MQDILSKSVYDTDLKCKKVDYISEPYIKQELYSGT